MGGHMGFGMASWTCKKRPRKPFSKRRRQTSCNTLPTYNRTFKLQPSKGGNALATFITLFLLGLFLVSFRFMPLVLQDHSNRMEILKQESNTRAFQFLMKSGVNRLKGQNLVGAYSEFKLAYNINPNHQELNELMLQTLHSLCEDENTYCRDLDVLLSKSL